MIYSGSYESIEGLSLPEVIMGKLSFAFVSEFEELKLPNYIGNEIEIISNGFRYARFIGGDLLPNSTIQSIFQ